MELGSVDTWLLSYSIIYFEEDCFTLNLSPLLNHYERIVFLLTLLELSLTELRSQQLDQMTKQLLFLMIIPPDLVPDSVQLIA